MWSFRINERKLFRSMNNFESLREKKERKLKKKTCWEWKFALNLGPEFSHVCSKISSCSLFFSFAKRPLNLFEISNRPQNIRIVKKKITSQKQKRRGPYGPPTDHHHTYPLGFSMSLKTGSDHEKILF